MMPKFSENTIQEIKNRLSIVDVVSDYVLLSKKNNRYWGLCPFHNEKTPSFTVVEDKGFYHCFGCGKSGSIFDFIMEEEHLSYPEAVRYLAKKAGVELKQETPQENIIRKEKESLQELYNKISQSFHFLLMKSKQGENARQYLESRKINKETQEKFLLGFAPTDESWLYRFLKKNNYSSELLKQSGLFSSRYPTYPLFVNRIMFPIRTWQGDCVAFGGRDLTGTSRAKYINTPETEIYSKRSLLFGLYEGLDSLKKDQEVKICEGNFDVISLHQAGLANTVAPLGTAFTKEQAKLLLRYVTKVDLLFDSDSAGQNATKKTLKLCQQMGLENSVIEIQNAKDVAEILQTQGEETLINCCSKSINGFDYLVQSALRMYDIKQPKNKFLIFKEVKPYLDSTSSEIEKESYIKKLAELLEVSERQIKEDYRKGNDGVINKRNSNDQKVILNPFQLNPDLYLMVTLANNRSIFDSVKGKLKIGLLTDDYAISLYTILEDAARKKISSDEAFSQLITNDELRNLVKTSFMIKMFRDKNIGNDINHAILRIQLLDIEKKRNSILNLLQYSIEENGLEVQNYSELLLQKKNLDERYEALKNEADNEDY